jgi:small neutral amino acid transporter SnatA (MarC family)
MKTSATKYILTIFMCYMTMSCMTFVDAVLKGSKTSLIERVSGMPFTMLGVPLLIFLIVNFYINLASDNSGKN